MPEYAGTGGTPPETWARYGVIGSQLQPALRAVDRVLRRGRAPTRHAEPEIRATPDPATQNRPSGNL
jgi:hypothetical protein